MAARTSDGELARAVRNAIGCGQPPLTASPLKLPDTSATDSTGPENGAEAHSGVALSAVAPKYTACEAASGSKDVKRRRKTQRIRTCSLKDAEHLLSLRLPMTGRGQAPLFICARVANKRPTSRRGRKWQLKGATVSSFSQSKRSTRTHRKVRQTIVKAMSKRWARKRVRAGPVLHTKHSAKL